MTESSKESFTVFIGGSVALGLGIEFMGNVTSPLFGGATVDGIPQRLTNSPSTAFASISVNSEPKSTAAAFASAIFNALVTSQATESITVMKIEIFEATDVACAVTNLLVTALTVRS
jgi:hypothetical protein